MSVPLGKRTLCPLAALAALVAACTVGAPTALAHGDEQVVRTERLSGHSVTVATHVDTRAELAQAAPSADASRDLGVPADIPSLGGPAGSLPAPWLADSWCGSETTANGTANAVDSTSPVIKVVYAYPSDQADRFNTYKSVIQEQIKTISGLVYATSGQLRSLRVDLGTSCGGAYVDIQTVQLPHALDYYRGYDVNGSPSRFDQIVNDVAAALGSSAQRRNALVYADYLGATNIDGTSFGAAGQGELITGPPGVSDQPGSGNPHNAGGFYAVAYGLGRTYFTSNSQAFGDEVPLHEITHTLGAVQDSAPHSSQAGHCYDESDVECYNDGGSYFATGGSTVAACSDGAHQVYDCNLDDYFSPSPAPGSYLATHWNLFNSVFLCDATTCGTGTTGAAAPPTSPAPPPTTVVSPAPTATNPPSTVAFRPGTLARAVSLVRATVRVAARSRQPWPTLRIGRAACPNVCRGAVSVYVLRGHGVRHALSLGRVSFSLMPGRSAELRVAIPTRVLRLLQRQRKLNASLTLTANRTTVTRLFTLRAS
ncbi:MAG TPA: hypothetical protein VGN71_02360 [Solirubrobacteraceae bacterium]|nr:hypothetical protein [Solirubrobacteraceae bacterium]